MKPILTNKKCSGWRQKLCLLLPLCLLVFFTGGCGSLETGASSGGDLFVSSSVQSQESNTKLPADSEVSSSAQTPDGIPAPFASYLAQAKEQIRKLSLKEKVGQLFLPRFPESGAPEETERMHPAGYILFARDFAGKDAGGVRTMLDACRDASRLPMIFGVDEEGGTVTRVSRYPALADEKFQSPQTVYKKGGLQGIIDDTKKKAAFLLDLGLALNFAPVADVSTDPDDFIYDRSFGKDAVKTAEYVKDAVTASLAEGVSPVLKHFPGYGSTADTHTGSAYDKRPYATFTESDFLPFEAGIQAGAPCVLICHNVVECMDAENPASLSPAVHRILREELGFQGVIITDDLAMQAIVDFSGSTDAAVLALKAGNDLILCSDFASSYQAVLDAVDNGGLSIERIEESAARVLAWKLWTASM